MQANWDPQQYLRHADNRARPYRDLLARIPEPPPLADGTRHRITDLGCGTADTTTVLLHHRWPDALVTGVDSSEEMLRKAAPAAGRVRGARGRLDLELADVREWTPGHPQHLIVSNAALQWVPGHADLLPRWVDNLAPGGTIALQMPANQDAPLHALLAETAAEPRYRTLLAGAADENSGNRAVLEPAEYQQRLAALGCATDIWETTYLHVLTGDDPVLDWVRGTALRPVLTALHDEADRKAFAADYGARLRTAYPRTEQGTTILPFRRIFAVATKPGETGAAQ